jgi:hypothetical protein
VSDRPRGPTVAQRIQNVVHFIDLLENTNLSPRLIAVLRRNSLSTLSGVAMMSDEDILLLPGIGQFYLAEIRRHR